MRWFIIRIAVARDFEQVALLFCCTAVAVHWTILLTWSNDKSFFYRMRKNKVCTKKNFDHKNSCKLYCLKKEQNNKKNGLDSKSNYTFPLALLISRFVSWKHVRLCFDDLNKRKKTYSAHILDVISDIFFFSHYIVELNCIAIGGKES